MKLQITLSVRHGNIKVRVKYKWRLHSFPIFWGWWSCWFRHVQTLASPLPLCSPCYGPRSGPWCATLRSPSRPHRSRGSRTLEHIRCFLWWCSLALKTLAYQVLQLNSKLQRNKVFYIKSTFEGFVVKFQLQCFLW